jgi:hypothetical protein
LRQNSHVIIFKDLNFRFLYKGFTPTFFREMPGFAIYFTTYEYLKKKIRRKKIFLGPYKHNSIKL